MEILWNTSRDNSRTPMQWNSGKNAGFSDGEPWLQVNPNYKQINVEAQEAETGSILDYYKAMIQLKKNHDVFTYGKYELIADDHPAVYAYTRTLAGVKAVVVTNLTGEEVEFTSEEPLNVEDLVLSNYDVTESSVLHPFEARVYVVNE